MDKKKVLIGVGIGLIALIIYSSTKKVELNIQEVVDPVIDKKSFSENSLPVHLKPPYRLAEGEIMQTAKRKSLNGISFKPRFDR